MKPVIGSGLSREYGSRFQRGGEPFPGTPWADARVDWSGLKECCYAAVILICVWAVL